MTKKRQKLYLVGFDSEWLYNEDLDIEFTIPVDCVITKLTYSGEVTTALSSAAVIALALTSERQTGIPDAVSQYDVLKSTNDYAILRYYNEDFLDYFMLPTTDEGEFVFDINSHVPVSKGTTFTLRGHSGGLAGNLTAGVIDFIFELELELYPYQM